MSGLSRHFRNIAREMESGRCRQTTGALAREDGTVCAMGCAHRTVLGMSEQEFTDFYLSDGPLTPRLTAAWGLDGERILEGLEAVAAKVMAYTGLQPNDPCIPTLNDQYGVPFPTFARAFFAVALELEEQEVGAPIPAAVETA